MNLYCITVEKEFDGTAVHHLYFNGEPTRNEVVERLSKEDVRFNDKYELLEFWKVSPIVSHTAVFDTSESTLGGFYNISKTARYSGFNGESIRLLASGQMFKEIERMLHVLGSSIDISFEDPLQFTLYGNKFEVAVYSGAFGDLVCIEPEFNIKTGQCP